MTTPCLELPPRSTAEIISQRSDFDNRWLALILNTGGRNTKSDESQQLDGRWARIFRFPDGSGIAIFGRRHGKLDYKVLPL